jgi:hypothetical protein
MRKLSWLVLIAALAAPAAGAWAAETQNGAAGNGKAQGAPCCCCCPHDGCRAKPCTDKECPRPCADKSCPKPSPG